ncbi:hypothetical protein F5883DRAFT_513843 [Diaporthe sp. PMI_573]|nr:hypothetical protein F5883DRAFT_513843 [Diaporthaceae sp. PMI_573]
MAAKLDVKAPSAGQSEKSRLSGDSVGAWPAFPDFVAVLRRLLKEYKLVIPSNVDRASFAKANEGPLEGFHFDLVITAQDVGSYKPDLRNTKDKFGVKQDQAIQTAQS